MGDNETNPLGDALLADWRSRRDFVVPLLARRVEGYRAACRGNDESEKLSRLLEMDAFASSAWHLEAERRTLYPEEPLAPPELDSELAPLLAAAVAAGQAREHPDAGTNQRAADCLGEFLALAEQWR